MRRKIILSAILLFCVLGAVYLFTSSNRVTDLKSALKVQRICIAQNKYQKSNNGKYATLNELSKDGLLDEELSKEESEGYKYNLQLNSAGYILLAIPIINQSETNSVRQLYVNEKSDKVKWKRAKLNTETGEEGDFFNKGQPLLCSE